MTLQRDDSLRRKYITCDWEECQDQTYAVSSTDTLMIEAIRLGWRNDLASVAANEEQRILHYCPKHAKALGLIIHAPVVMKPPVDNTRIASQAFWDWYPYQVTRELTPIDIWCAAWLAAIAQQHD